MSGQKCSSIDLDKPAEVLIQCKGEKDITSKEIQALSNRMTNLTSKLEEMTTKHPDITGRLTEYKELIKKESLTLEERKRQLEDIQLPESIRGVNIDWLTKIQEGILKIKGEAQEIKNVLDEIDLSIINLNFTDKTLSSIEFNRQRFQNELQGQEILLKKWMPGEYNGLTGDYETFQAKLTLNKETLRNRKDTIEIAKNFSQAEQMLNALNSRLTELSKEAIRKEELHHKRLYILKGLRDVCASLGFEEVSGPRYEKEGDFNSPVFQTFDTLDEGLVTFKLHLHDLIESDSGIRLEGCEDEFGKLSKLLGDSYGVHTTFERVGREEGPKRISKTEKPMSYHKPQTGKIAGL